MAFHLCPWARVVSSWQQKLASDRLRRSARDCKVRTVAATRVFDPRRDIGDYFCSCRDLYRGYHLKKFGLDKSIIGDNLYHPTLVSCGLHVYRVELGCNN